MKTRLHLQLRNRQKGVILLAAILFTVVMTAMVLSVTRSAVIEERVSSNEQNRQLALQSAEAIVRDAESSVFTGPPLDPFNPAVFTNNCQNGFCILTVDNRWLTHDWGNPNRVRSFSDAGANLQGVPAQPVYFIEYVDLDGNLGTPLCPKLTFRVVGRGLAADGAESLIETMYNFRPSSFADGSCGS